MADDDLAVEHARRPGDIAPVIGPLRGLDCPVELARLRVDRKQLPILRADEDPATIISESPRTPGKAHLEWRGVELRLEPPQPLAGLDVESLHDAEPAGNIKHAIDLDRLAIGARHLKIDRRHRLEPRNRIGIDLVERAIVILVGRAAIDGPVIAPTARSATGGEDDEQRKTNRAAQGLSPLPCRHAPPLRFARPVSVRRDRCER